MGDQSVKVENWEKLKCGIFFYFDLDVEQKGRSFHLFCLILRYNYILCLMSKLFTIQRSQSRASCGRWRGRGEKVLGPGDQDLLRDPV